MRSQLPARAILAALLLSLPVALSAQAKPYSLADIEGLLTRKVRAARILELATAKCIDFPLSATAKTRLRTAGATATFLTSLGRVCSPTNPRRPLIAASELALPAQTVVAPKPEPPAPPPMVIDSSVTVRIRAAVIGNDLSVRAVPQLDLLVIGPRGDTVRLATDLDGVASRTFKRGIYRIESTQPIELNGNRYRWGIYSPIEPGMGSIELTQKNAQVEVIPAPVVAAASAPVNSSSTVGAQNGDGAATPSGATVASAPPPAAPKPTRRVSEEAMLFERYRSGVFTVFGREEKATGFLIDSSGVVLTTSHHLVAGDEVRVQIDSLTKLAARVVDVDKTRDVAVLAINMKRCAKCTVLVLPDTGRAPVGTGERVLALGSPMHRSGVLSIGIVNSVEPQGIVSDVKIGYMNNGGPLLNLDGRVVAINTYRTAARPNAPRTATSVPIADLDPLIEKAKVAISTFGPLAPKDSLLPVLPRTPFPAEPIRAVASNDIYDVRPYQLSEGPFRIFMMTPQLMAWRQAQASRALENWKRAKGNKAGNREIIDPIQLWRDWDEYVTERRAVIVFNVMPSRAAFPFYEPDKLQDVMDGDMQDMKLFRDGRELIPVERLRIPAVVNVEEHRGAGRRVALQGVYVYRAEDFAPRPDGSAATYTLTLWEQSRPSTPIRLTIDPRKKMIEAIWRDFTAYRFGGGR
jgi:S1-C subfamily serine protease